MKNDDWQIISTAQLAVINFRYNPKNKSLDENQLNELNQHISKQVIISREAMLATTVLNHQIVLRMCLINPRTTINDVKEIIDLCVSIAIKPQL